LRALERWSNAGLPSNRGMAVNVGRNKAIDRIAATSRFAASSRRLTREILLNASAPSEDAETA